MTVEFQFPIDKLPARPFTYVLRTMDLVDRVAYSFISPQSKQQICALPQRKVASMMVFFTTFIRIRIYFDEKTFEFIDFSFLAPHSNATELSIPVVIRVQESDTLQQNHPVSTFPNRQGYTFKEYVDHLTDIFHCKEFTLIYFDMPSEIYPSEGIWNAFNRFSEVERVYVNTIYSEKLVLEFVSKAKVFVIQHKHPFDRESLRKVFIQNFDEFCMQHSIISLDDLLLINSTEAKIVTEFNEKQLNMFLKSWRSGSNPRLRRLSIDIRKQKNASVENVLKGIKCVETLDWDQLDFFDEQAQETIGMKETRRLIFAGYEIFKFDANAKATVLIDRRSIGCKMLVQQL